MPSKEKFDFSVSNRRLKRKASMKQIAKGFKALGEPATVRTAQVKREM
jgi:hypothetical protein